MEKTYCANLGYAKPEDRFLFEHHSYFIADKKESVIG